MCSFPMCLECESNSKVSFAFEKIKFNKFWKIYRVFCWISERREWCDEGGGVGWGRLKYIQLDFIDCSWFKNFKEENDNMQYHLFNLSMCILSLFFTAFHRFTWTFWVLNEVFTDLCSLFSVNYSSRSSATPFVLRNVLMSFSHDVVSRAKREYINILFLMFWK